MDLDQKYIESLDQDERAAWGLSVFIRHWLSAICRTEATRQWTLPELAIVFEVTQAHLFADEPHTQSSLTEELRLPQQMVSRSVRRLERRGIIEQVESPDDARVKILIPKDNFLTRDGLIRVSTRFANFWFDNWKNVDKARSADWYSAPSQCSDETVQRKGKKLRNLGRIP